MVGARSLVSFMVRVARAPKAGSLLRIQVKGQARFAGAHQESKKLRPMDTMWTRGRFGDLGGDARGRCCGRHVHVGIRRIGSWNGSGP
jgi:hypothetical protein